MMTTKFTRLWEQAESDYLDHQHQYEGFDVGKSVKQRFAELIVQQCVVHVDAWTGTIYTPATDRILNNIRQEFDMGSNRS